MNIPSSFNLFGKKFFVKIVHRLRDHFECNGIASLRDNYILLQGNCEGIKISEQQMEEAFVHELTHEILNEMERHDLCEDEDFVRIFSKLMYQYMKSAEYNNIEEIQTIEDFCMSNIEKEKD